MIKELTRFSFDDKSIRTFGTKLEPWFALADICKILELGNPSRVADRLDDDEKGITISNTLGGPQEILIVSEPGLYEVIFQSRKPEARRFRRWVTHEVLPSIRKHGYYVNPRWGFAPTDDGMWVLATGERLTPIQVIQKAEKLGIGVSSHSELKDVIREINQRESYLAVREKYPYSYDEVDRDYGEVEYYRCFIKDNEDRSIYSKDYWIDEYFSEAFIELIKRVDEEENSRRS